MELNGKYAWIVKMGSKGQIVIPSEARKMFNYNPGDDIMILGDITQGLAIVDSKKFSQIFDIISNGEKQR